MPLAFKVAAVDSNPTGASPFVSITRPAAVADGDVLLVTIAVNTPGVVVTPPDDSWTQLASSDPAQQLAVAVFWKLALLEPVRWVFALSATVDAEGAMAAYSGADGFSPIDASIVRLTPSTAGASTTLGRVSTSMADEELVAFLCARGTVTYGPQMGYLVAAQKQQTGTTTNGTIAIARRGVLPAGLVPSSSYPYAGTAVETIGVLIALRPSYGQLSIEEVYERYLQGFPKGVDRIYDLTPTGDYFAFFMVIATVLKVFGYDLIDLMNVEKNPRFSVYMLPDWERAFGLTNTSTARWGTVPQRQAQVVASFRALAGQGSAPPAITAVLGPLLGYFDSTPVEIIGMSRDTLTLMHSYSHNVLWTIPAGQLRSQVFYVNDGGVVSSGGTRLILEFGAPAGAGAEVHLIAPDGSTSQTWITEGGEDDFELLFDRDTIGSQCGGTWQIVVDNASASDLSIIWTVHVEGCTEDWNEGQTTGAAMFEWGVYADPAHMGENGTPADLNAVRRALARIDFAPTNGSLILAKAGYPNVATGPTSSQPNAFLPTT